MNHPIFRTPNAVQATVEDRATPSYYAREQLGKTMPMWRVQTEGYSEGTGQLIGMVSRDKGFLDSPDTEWISSGVNSKSSKAVAIGRHGNFFHWGFAASPTYLTEEAKLVFVNSVHYIAKFDGHGLIARKTQGTAMRSYMVSALAQISAAGYAETVARYKGYAAENQKRKDAVQKRIDAGEKVSDADRRVLTFPAPRAPGRFAPIKRFIAADVWPELDGDEAAIRAYVHSVLPYVRSQGWYELVVDEELRKFGVGNNDPQLLPRLIAALKQGDGKIARTLLARYTEESFATNEQWVAWYELNRANLFFTESGGYKWLVNTRANGAATWRRVVSKDGLPVKAAKVVPAATKAKHAAAKAKLDEQANSDGPLQAKVLLKTLASGNHELRLVIAIQEGWHAYQSVPEGSPYELMKVDLDLPAGLQQKGKWQEPVGQPYADDPDLIVYEGKVAFRCELTGKLPNDLSKIACSLSYQVCDANMCLPPTVAELTPKKL